MSVRTNEPRAAGNKTKQNRVRARSDEEKLETSRTSKHPHDSCKARGEKGFETILVSLSRHRMSYENKMSALIWAPFLRHESSPSVFAPEFVHFAAGFATPRERGTVVRPACTPCCGGCCCCLGPSAHGGRRKPLTGAPPRGRLSASCRRSWSPIESRQE